MKEPFQHDPLTGLPDRAYLWSFLDDTLKQIRRNTSFSGVLLIQLNNMNGISSLVGEKGVDEFIKTMASRLKNCLWDPDMAIRFEYDKFVVVANSINRQEDIHVVVQKIHDYLALDLEVCGRKISPSTAIGIVMLPSDATEVDEIMSNAAMAFKMAKPHGGNRYCYYNNNLASRIAEQEAVKLSILRTLEQESFVLMLQPKIDTATRKICGVEALVRMRDSDGNIVTPNEFIPVAENSDLILKIGDWVLSRANALTTDWKLQGIELPISINISDIQFKNSAILLSSLHRLAAENKENAKNIILEISENIIATDVNLATALMAEIKSYGFQISLDGFGSGFSNLSVLKTLKLDEIKIDRQFLDNVPSNEKNTEILKSIILLGKSMNFRVVVMGVESEDQLEILKTNNCDEFQGFLISEPIVEEEFIDWKKNYSV